MTLVDVVILAIVQGLTEFLPISSSGHLVLAQYFLGVQSPGVSLEVVLHLGTLISVIVVFYADILGLAQAGISFITDLHNKRSEHLAQYRRLILLLAVGTIPTAIIGVLFSDTFESLFAAPRFIGYALLVTGAVLLASSRLNGQRTMPDVNYKDTLLLGLAQGLAITPGISRSGITIATGLFRNFDRDTATRCSFLLSLPAVLGAAVLKVPELATDYAAHPVLHIIIGIAVSALVGIVAIKYLVAMLKRGRLQYFAYYAFTVGILTLLFVR